MFWFLFWWRPPCLLRTVIVNQVADPSALQGVLWGSRGAWLTLKDVFLLRAGVPPIKVDGDVVIHRDRVAFIQVVP